jgi:hypothetical protein
MADGDEQELEWTWAPLAEVAAAYGVSIDTIRRRMKRGELEARRQQTPQGFKWLALMPDRSEPVPPEPSRDASGVSQQSDTLTLGVQVIERDREELVETLRQELALRNREIARLHEVIASQAKAIEVTMAALPANAPTVEQPAPATMTETSDAPASARVYPETFWARVRKWFGGA